MVSTRAVARYGVRTALASPQGRRSRRSTATFSMSRSPNSELLVAVALAQFSVHAALLRVHRAVVECTRCGFEVFIIDRAASRAGRWAISQLSGNGWRTSLSAPPQSVLATAFPCRFP